MKSYGLAVSALDPETGHEEDDYVGGERRGECVEGTACSLLRVVNVFREILQPCGSSGDIDLHKTMVTIGPEE